MYGGILSGYLLRQVSCATDSISITTRKQTVIFMFLSSYSFF